MLKQIEISGFKSFAKKTALSFDTPITAIVGPNGSGKSNVVESIRFVLGEQSMKSLRGKGGADLIWKGSKMLAAGSKARVAITFDNADRKFAFSSSSGAAADLSFDEITLAREVTMDGGSEYFINGTGVRLKDITELLGSVNIGASGHHIISQGEADRLLSASARDRRGMVEDALGLKVYQMRIREAERKIEKTAQNMKEVAALRRELAPHLNFLGKQVEKIKMAEELRREFAQLFADYAAKEAGAAAFSERHFSAEEEGIRRELAGIPAIETGHGASPHDAERAAVLDEVRAAEGEAMRLSREREELGRALGRIEGKLDALSVVRSTPGATSVPARDVEALCGEIVSILDDAEHSTDLSFVRSAITGLRNKVRSFSESLKGKTPETDTGPMRAEIEHERARLEQRLQEIDVYMKSASNQAEMSRGKLAALDAAIRDAERSSYQGAARRATLEGQLRECALRIEGVLRRKALLDEEMKEAEALAGISFSAAAHSAAAGEDTPESVAEREALHRKLERIKIKLEDAGAASGAEVLKEYEDTKDRDAFLARELADIETSLASLRELIHELRATIERTFKEGIEKINVQFGEFFKLMFGGGGAFLSIIVEHKRVRDDGEVLPDESDADALPFEHGIEINVSLPHKKVRDLAMLSGGERSLISIALLFAMSQVNPPPFLVLDETDAALDEANSRKYGDMLEHLSQHSKLVVVTHNRETMSRAQVLYGVTMGLEGASKLLSIKFDEAVLIAK